MTGVHGGVWNQEFGNKLRVSSNSLNHRVKVKGCLGLEEGDSEAGSKLGDIGQNRLRVCVMGGGI